MHMSKGAMREGDYGLFVTLSNYTKNAQKYLDSTPIIRGINGTELVEEIRAFEDHTYNPELEMIHPSPEVVYQCNLEYLGKLCELIAEKYNQEYVWGETADESYLEVIRDYLKSKGLGYNTSLTQEIEKRKAGKQYTIRDHIRGLIYSLLTNQTKWYRVEPHLPEIDELFYAVSVECLCKLQQVEMGIPHCVKCGIPIYWSFL